MAGVERCWAKRMMVSSGPSRTMKIPRYAAARIMFGLRPNLATTKPSPANATAVRI